MDRNYLGYCLTEEENVRLIEIWKLDTKMDIDLKLDKVTFKL